MTSASVVLSFLLAIMLGILFGAVFMLIVRKPDDNEPNVIDMLDEIMGNHKEK
jgi:hypothetical protein